jgi:hypothetical protein
MSNIRNPFVFTPTGQAMPVAAPPVLRVMEGRATAEQLDMAQKVFHQFCTRARLSVVPNPREGGFLPDGSRYEINVVGTVQTMLLWPVGSGGGAFIAWTAFFNSSHLPIWERPLVDFPYDDLPPRPEPPGPEPEYPPLAEAYAFATITGLPVTFPVGLHRVSKLYIGWGLLTDEPTLIAEGSWIVTEIGRVTTEFVDYGYYRHVRTNYYTGSDFYESVTVQNLVAGALNYYNEDIDGSNYNPVTPSRTSVAGMYDAAAAAAAAYNAGAISAWEAAHAAWSVAQGQYLTALAEWTEQREVLLALQRPWFPVQDARNAARPSQVAAVKAHLMGGIGDRHLTARILSFPYNVAYRSIPAPGAGGTITNESVSTSTLLSFRTTLTNAQPFTTIPRWDDGDNDMYPERLLRVDFMPPENLFGWTANGSAQYGYRFHMENPRTEHYVLMPPGLNGITATVPDGYFADTRIVPDNSPGLVVSSDAFVPVGSTVTVVLFEYRVADPYTGAMYWTGCPDLMLHDSIWIRDAGVYIDVPRVVDELFTERVRIAGVITQKRTAWGTWSAPLETPRAKLVQGGWDARYVAAVEYVRPAKAPAAVVIVENLAAGANPASTQVGTFHMNATFLWNGDAQAITKAKGAPWVADAALAPQKQFIVRALIATGKIKP